MQLFVTWKGQTGTAYLLDSPEILIGRGGDSQIDLSPSKFVSRAHAVIAQAFGGHVLRDLKTANGTRLNDVVIAEQYHLSPGDRIVIGEHELVYDVATEQAQSVFATFSGWVEPETFRANRAHLEGLADELRMARASRLHVTTADGVEESIALRKNKRTRIGVDPRCEIPLPRVGMFEKKVTLHVAFDEEESAWSLVPRSGRAPKFSIDGEAVRDTVVLEDGDTIEGEGMSIEFFVGRDG